MNHETKEHNVDDTINSAVDAAKKADEAVRETAQKSLDGTGLKLDLRQLEKSIRDKPLHAFAIASAVGFVFGGGMATRPGWAMLALFGRKAARETTNNLISGVRRATSR